ncbi:uncharacterized protein LOC133195979 [Saccostrea echinata]|uniref:uncharacterized protein LOC133195979 n=1 Tax=Saccostrea echinata TaxID=191078 RepID=UPI002A8251CA|nr:uncharacterized protein LOC133195979 [Saccostrea echinata]
MGILSQKRKRRQEFTGLKALASGVLALAKAHAELDKTEKSLEHEIERENRKPPSTCIGRSRFLGYNLMHTKQVLMCIVVLNVIDCVLVLGELILDIFYLKRVLDHEEMANSYFVKTMKSTYPEDLHDLYETDINVLHSMILSSRVDFTSEISAPYSSLAFTSSVGSQHNETNYQQQPKLDKRSLRGADVYSEYFINNSSEVWSSNVSANLWNFSNKSHAEIQHDDHSQSIEVILAHKLHYCSISILAILVVENVLKLICGGKEYFEKKLEVFDGIIVVASFVVDLVFIRGLSAYKTQKFVVILAFLVPWRVIRVVNSLVVAVIDHEHFRMKLLYKQKKQVANDLKTSKADNKALQTCIESLRSRAVLAGIPEAELDDIIGSSLTPVKKKSVKKTSTSCFPAGFNLGSLGFSRQSSTANPNTNTEVIYVDVDNNTCFHDNDEKK